MQGLTAIIDVDSGEEYVFGNDFTIEDIVWMGVLPTIKELSQSVGVQKTGNNEELNQYLKRRIKNLAAQFTIFPLIVPSMKLKYLTGAGDFMPNEAKKIRLH